MRLDLALTTVLLIAQAAAALEPGDEMVVARPVDMKTITGSTLALTPGAAVTVRTVEGDRLKVAAGRVGWIEASAVVPAKEAEAFFSRQIEKDPGDASALLARGKVRFQEAGLDNDKIDRAIADLDRSLKLAASSEAHTIRGFAWKRKGDKDQAIAEFDAAIRLNPREALAWRVRGATYASKADYARALADYSESLRVDPENPDSLHHRVVLRSACIDAQYRNGKQAIEDATKACEVSEWKAPLYISGLALACAESGDFDSAVKWQLKALELWSSPPASMTANLELFRQHKPFRMTWR
jgi:tetratricopeptide (TPR) repeat protein